MTSFSENFWNQALEMASPLQREALEANPQWREIAPNALDLLILANQYLIQTRRVTPVLFYTLERQCTGSRWVRFLIPDIDAAVGAQTPTQGLVEGSIAAVIECNRINFLEVALEDTDYYELGKSSVDFAYLGFICKIASKLGLNIENFEQFWSNARSFLTPYQTEAEELNIRLEQA